MSGQFKSASGRRRSCGLLPYADKIDIILILFVFGSSGLIPLGRPKAVRTRMTMPSCLIGKCSSSLIRNRLRSGLRNLRFYFRKSGVMLFSSFDLLRESAVAMLSPKPRRHMSSPMPPSRVVDRPRAAVAIAEAVRLSRAPPGRTSHGRARSPECSPSRARRSRRSVGVAAPTEREGNFSSLQTLENKRNRIGIPKFSRSEAADATRRPSRRTERSCDAASPASFAGIGGPADAGRRNSRRKR